MLMLKWRVLNKDEDIENLDLGHLKTFSDIKYVSDALYYNIESGELIDPTSEGLLQLKNNVFQRFEDVLLDQK